MNKYYMNKPMNEKYFTTATDQIGVLFVSNDSLHFGWKVLLHLMKDGSSYTSLTTSTMMTRP